MKLKHRVPVSTPDQRTGPFRINVLILTQCYLLRARGISAHFVYTIVLALALVLVYTQSSTSGKKLIAWTQTAMTVRPTLQVVMY